MVPSDGWRWGWLLGNIKRRPVIRESGLRTGYSVGDDTRTVLDKRKTEPEPDGKDRGERPTHRYSDSRPVLLYPVSLPIRSEGRVGDFTRTRRSETGRPVSPTSLDVLPSRSSTFLYPETNWCTFRCGTSCRHTFRCGVFCRHDLILHSFYICKSTQLVHLKLRWSISTTKWTWLCLHP